LTFAINLGYERVFELVTAILLLVPVFVWAVLGIFGYASALGYWGCKVGKF
jgi:hypothetical protein